MVAAQRNSLAVWRNLAWPQACNARLCHVSYSGLVCAISSICLPPHLTYLFPFLPLYIFAGDVEYP